MNKRKLTLGLLAIGLLAATWVGSRLWADKTNIYTSLEVFQRVLQITRDTYVREVDLDSMVQNAMNGMLRELDPYSMYMSPKEFEALDISMQGEFGGLGINIGITDDWLTVISPLEGTPAAEAGLQAGDRIIKIEGESTEGITTDEAVMKLRGEPGTKVTISIWRNGWNEPIDLTITRAIIKLNAVDYVAKLTPEIGYIKFSKFSRTAREEMEDALDSLFRIEGVKKLVLDVRMNSGGYLGEGVDVSDLFLERDLEIVQTRGRIPQSFRTYRSHEDPLFGDYPLVVLADQGSASAAEILTGALQDWERALVVGDTTFGKGSVQTIYPLSDSGRLKLTTAHWYTPSGRCIDKHRAEMEGKGNEPATLHTLGKRKRPLYAGGAIAPDIYVETEKLTDLTTLLWSNRVFFSYAVDYLSASPDIDPDFPITDEMLAGLADEARKRKIEFTDSEFEESKEQLIYRLRVEIAGQKWGEAGRYQIALTDDPIVKKALELLAKAESTSDLFSYAQ
jgi:carboxyl-terminal processing protease